MLHVQQKLDYFKKKQEELQKVRQSRSTPKNDSQKKLFDDANYLYLTEKLKQLDNVIEVMTNKAENLKKEINQTESVPKSDHEDFWNQIMLDEKKSEIEKLIEGIEKLILVKSDLTIKVKNEANLQGLNVDLKANQTNGNQQEGASDNPEVTKFEPIDDQNANQSDLHLNKEDKTQNEISANTKPVFFIEKPRYLINESNEPRIQDILPVQNKPIEVETYERDNQPYYLDDSNASFSPKKIKFGYTSVDHHKHIYDQPTYIHASNYDQPKEQSDENIEVQDYSNKVFIIN